MPASAIARKLVIRPGHRIAPIGAPADYASLLGELPEGATIVDDGPADVIHLFVRDQAELGRGLPAALERVGSSGILWISYPKLSSTARSDVSRDSIWQHIRTKGWDGVSQISIDDTWSAMRFRPARPGEPPQGERPARRAG